MSGTGSMTTAYTGLTATSYTIEPVEADLYYYRVQAVCDDGVSEWSDWMDVDVAIALGCETAVNAPSGEIYDMSGRRLQRIPKHGLFIRGGKTYMAR